jgi:hypothetical protein
VRPVTPIRVAMAKVEAMARAKLNRLREARGRDSEGTREVSSELFEPGDLRLSPVEVPNPGRNQGSEGLAVR